MPNGRFSRSVLVTLGLSATGVIVGGVLGALITKLLARIADGPGYGWTNGLAFGAWFGGIVGAVAAPCAAWTLMRHVPIGRAIAETAMGTAIGAGIGLLLGLWFPSSLLSALPLGLLGFAIAAIRLAASSVGEAISSDRNARGDRGGAR
jgi:hypothetical protein